MRANSADNRISEQGAVALAEALEYNQSLVLLSLRGAHLAVLYLHAPADTHTHTGNLDMGDSGVSAIVKSLTSNNTLRNLFLSRADFIFAGALLSLSAHRTLGMRLGNETAYALAVALRKNTTLEELSLTGTI